MNTPTSLISRGTAAFSARRKAASLPGMAALFAGLCLLALSVSSPASAQGTAPGWSYSVLHSFCLSPSCADGVYLPSGVTLDAAGNIYGTAYEGGVDYAGDTGISGPGTLFRIDPSGNFKRLYDFCSHTGCTDGWHPSGTLVQDAAGSLYGTTFQGGTGDSGYGGTVFKLDSAGNETVLYSFCQEVYGGVCTDGANPNSGVIRDGEGNLYGITTGGGYGAYRSTYDYYGGAGTVFKLDTTGQLTILHVFCSSPDCSDGIPNTGAPLVLDAAGNLYGATENGGVLGEPGEGINGYGTVFKIDTNGNFSVLYSFCSLANCADGKYPFGGLILDSAGNLYGTTAEGGAYNSPYGTPAPYGTIFKLNPSTGVETVLYSFCPDGESNCPDGSDPQGGLVFDSAGNLYGTTTEGGNGIYPQQGTVFKLDTTGNLTTLYNYFSLPNAADGRDPIAGLAMDTAGNLYGTTPYGFLTSPTSYSGGTVFKLSPAATTPTITWPTPSAITYGTALTGTQLNATTTVAGTFSYSPVAGTVLGAGTQTLSVTFYPADTNAYTTATATVQLVVNKAVLTVAPAPPAGGAPYFTLGYGDRFPYSTDLCQISGFVNGDTLSAVSGSPNPTVSWVSNPTPPVGNYTLSCALGTLAAANYTFSLNSAPETIQVTPGVITIKPYGGAANYGNGRPTIGYEATGLVYGQTAAGVLSGPPIITTTAPAHPNAGYYPVTANVSGLTAANYTVVAGPPGTITIWTGPLNVTAKNAAVRYGQSIPTALQYSLVGLRYSDTAAVLSATPSVSTTATNPAAAGAYPINVNLNGANAANYSVNPVNGTLTVLPATLLVLPTSIKAVYGAPLPSFTDTITGFEYADTAAGVYSGSPSLTSSATQGSPVGEYSINSAPGSLSLISSNYAFSYRVGKLTIDKAPLTVKATSITITQGSAIPTLTYTMAGFVNGDSQASATTGTPTLTTTATSASAPGVYPIKIAVGTLAAGNYGFTFVNGTLTITP